jgi:hypothetical protein
LVSHRQHRKPRLPPVFRSGNKTPFLPKDTPYARKLRELRATNPLEGDTKGLAPVKIPIKEGKQAVKMTWLDWLLRVGHSLKRKARKYNVCKLVALRFYRGPQRLCGFP